MEEKTKKTAAAKASTKKAAEVSPTDKKATTKKAKDASAEKTAATAKAAPKAKAPAKAAASQTKVADGPVAEKPASKKAAAAKTKVAEAPAAEKPASKKAAASKTKVTEAPVAEKPAPKKAAAPKAKVADAPAAEKPASKKAAAPKTKVADAPVAEKPASKKAAAAKTKVADAPVAEKPASKKAAAAKTKVADAPVAEKPASKKAATKTVKAAKEAAPAVEAATTEESTKKVRTKPRRRELKRLGLLQPKENKKQKIFDEAQRARLGGKDTSAKKSKLNPAEIRLQAKAKNTEQKPASPAEDKAKPRDHKAEDRSEPKAKGKDSKAKLMPEEFGGFQKQISPKAERKNERRKERMEKAEREIDQSHGLFEEPIRLNRFVALSGICSRRDADALISDGKVKVNGKVVREMGYKVKPGQDKVVYKDHELRIKVFVYLLMNKPKNKLTTTDDDLGRDTVMEIADRYTKARVYPVGRLDRNTTGLLLLTNDGDLTQKLTHPSSKFPKIYHVRLNKEVSETHVTALRKGIELEDGMIKADKVEYLTSGALNEIAIQIHSGANHIVKRMMEHLGYEVVTLDRVQFGPLDKRGLPRGTCRLLTEKEVGFLKML